jgi:putative hydrolase of the HAD superfamily
LIRAILFDLDGTLFDRDTTVRCFVERQYDTFLPALGHIARTIYVNRFMELDARGYVPKDLVYQTLVAEYSIVGVSAETLCSDFFQRYQEECIAFPSLHTMLQHFHSRGVKLGIITNGREAIQRPKVRALGIEAYFDAILVSESEGIKKPDARIFHRALECLGVPPVQALYVGDHPENDIAGARAAGLKAVWKHDEYWPVPAEADGIIDDLGELILLVDMLG